jgi:N-methylhydantoinase A
VTDADIALGFLNPDYFLGGTQNLDAGATAAALEARIAKPLGMTMREAAAGIRHIVDMRMADAVRVFAAKRGVSVQDFALLPFGGAGAVHAAVIADELGIGRILVPPRPGAFSALGLLCTDIVHDYVRSALRPLEQVLPEHAEAIFRELESRAADELVDEGLGTNGAVYERELDMRYTGQGYELRVSLQGIGRGALTSDAMRKARARFDERHAQIHGHAAEDRPVEIVSYRLRVRVPVPKYRPVAEKAVKSRSAPRSAIKGTRIVYFDAKAGTETALYERDRLPPGARLYGPAIIEQLDATTVVPPGWSATVDGFKNLILARTSARHG